MCVVTTAHTFPDPYFFALDVPDQGKTGKKELLFSRIIMLFLEDNETFFQGNMRSIDGTKIPHCMRDTLVGKVENL